MTPAGLAALGLVFAGIVIAARRWRAGPWIAGLAGFTVLLVGSWSLPLGQRAILGDEVLVSTGYLRLVLMLAAASGGTLTFVGAATGGNRGVPALALLWFGATATALSLVSPIPAILLLTTGSVAAILMAVDEEGAERALIVARGLRAIVVAGILAAIAILWAEVAGTNLRLGLGDGASPPDGGALGLAFLAAALAVALRAGAIPVHVWASRLGERLPILALPVTFAWGPAALAIVVLGWADQGVIALGQPLLVERGVIASIAVASIIFGALAAYLHDDVERVVAYTLTTDSGVVLLAVAAASPEAWGPARIWILAYIVAKSAFAGWAAAVRTSFGTTSVPRLGGWARRSPLLAAGLILIAITSIGLPGLAAFDARAQLISLALPAPFNVVAWIGILASSGAYLRLLIIGFAPATGDVGTAANLQPAWPGGRPARLSFDLVRQLPDALRLNRAPAAAASVLVLGLLGLSVAAGALHTTTAAGAPQPGAGTFEEVSPTASPSAMPIPTVPRATVVPGGGAGASALPTAGTSAPITPRATPAASSALPAASPAAPASTKP